MDEARRDSGVTTMTASRLIGGVRRRVLFQWRHFWVSRSGPHGFGRFAARIAGVGTGPYHGREFLSYLHPNGFVAHTAWLDHPRMKIGQHVFVGDHVISRAGVDGAEIDLADRVHLYGDSVLNTAHGARLTIGEHTHVQRGAHLIACLADITIGRNCEIAPCCAFYSYDHGMAPDIPIMTQPLQSKGPIILGDDVWLGHGVIVLSGVRIGKGAVIGAGSVVTSDIPDNAIAAGHPARVIKFRDRPADLVAARFSVRS